MITNGNRNLTAAIIFMAAFTGACSHDSSSPGGGDIGGGSVSRSQTGSYNYTENGCSTGRQTYGSIEELCSKLADDKLNNGCALDLRVDSYEVNCAPAPASTPAPVVVTPMPKPVFPPAPVPVVPNPAPIAPNPTPSVNQPPSAAPSLRPTSSPVPPAPGPTPTFYESVPLSGAESVSVHSAIIEVCDSFYSGVDKIKCLHDLKTAKFQLDILPVCLNFTSAQDQKDCFVKLQDKRFARGAVAICEGFSSLRDSAACLANLADMSFQSQVVSVCSSYSNVSDEENCLKNIGSEIFPDEVIAVCSSGSRASEEEACLKAYE